MYERVVRMLGHIMREFSVWSLAVRVGKFAPEARPLLAARARRAAAAVRVFCDALDEAYALRPYGSRYGHDLMSMVNELVDHPHDVWPLVPDAESTVRAMATIEYAAQDWSQELSRATITGKEALRLRWEAGRTAQALEDFATFAETFDADSVLEWPAESGRLGVTN